jgi:hypothetical protein
MHKLSRPAANVEIEILTNFHFAMIYITPLPLIFAVKFCVLLKRSGDAKGRQEKKY